MYHYSNSIVDSRYIYTAGDSRRKLLKNGISFSKPNARQFAFRIEH